MQKSNSYVLGKDTVSIKNVRQARKCSINGCMLKQ